MQELNNAIAIAVEYHDGKYDKGENPYILHPLKVMHYTKSSEVAVLCAAVLHDVIEDTDCTYAVLRERGISEETIEAIRSLTKQPGQTYEEYQDCVLANRIARIVKKADLRHNSDLRRLKGVTEKDINRAAKYMMFYHKIEEFESCINMLNELK